jgi:chaperone required for assembly of F1-ATPase
MTGWAPKRFWTDATAVTTDAGHTVTLDGRPVRTPAKAPLTLPTLALAQTIAAEWAAQGAVIDPRSMPLTRAANSAIDTVAANHATVVATVAAYGATDLLCYRAETPAGLVAEQAAAWDPLLDWAARTHGARLATGTGIVHIAQDPGALAALTAAVDALDPFALTALHDLASLSGSLVIGLAALSDDWPAGALWQASRIDEDWQARAWGVDEEAAANAERRRQDFRVAQVFHRLSRRE